MEGIPDSKVYRVSPLTSKGGALHDIDHYAGQSGPASYSSIGFIYTHTEKPKLGLDPAK